MANPLDMSSQVKMQTDCGPEVECRTGVNERYNVMKIAYFTVPLYVTWLKELTSNSVSHEQSHVKLTWFSGDK